MVIPCSRSALSPSVIREKSISSPRTAGCLLQGLDVILVQGVGVVEHAADEGGLAVVDAAGRGESEQIRLAFPVKRCVRHGHGQKYPSRFFCSIDPSWSWSMMRVMRSECLAAFNSSMISRTVRAVERTAPVQGSTPGCGSDT